MGAKQSNINQNNFQKGNGKRNEKNQNNNISLANKNINNNKKKNNISKDNSINNNEIKLNVIIETLIRIYHFENKIKDLCKKEDNKTNNSTCVIASRNLIERYKEIFQLKSLINQFNNPTTLKYINYLISICDITNENKNEIYRKGEYISKIIAELKKGNEALMNKIKGNIGLLTELNNEAKLNYKSINLKEKQKKVIVDFTIINYDIFLLLIEQNILVDNFLFADYFISSYDILVLIKKFGDCSNNVICEVGKINKKDQSINIEYLLDDDKIQGSTDLKYLLKDINISEIYQKISKTKNENDEIEFIEYNFDFPTDNRRKIFFIRSQSLISDENEKKLNEITTFKKNNDINLRSEKNDENKINKIGEDSDNIINKEEFKVLSKNREKLEEKILKKNPNENLLNNEIIRSTEEQKSEEKLYEEKPIEEKSSKRKTKTEEPKEEKKSGRKKKKKRDKRTSLKGDKMQEESQKVEEVINKGEEKSSKEKLSGEENIKKEEEEEKERESNNKNLKIIKEENKNNENSEIENNIHNLNNKNSENEISKLLNEQKKLIDKIKDLENKLKEKDDLINDFIETINKLKDSLNDNIHQNANLNENLMRKNIEIEELKKETEQLKLKLSKFPFELSEKEELVSIIITSFDERVNSCYLCKNTDKFIKIEKEFYNKYPQYKNLDNYFTINGNKINPELSLDENKII